MRTQTRTQLARSIIRDLEWLLNTRCTRRFDMGEEAGRRTVLDFGLDDFTHLAPASHDDRQIMARQIRQAIAAFEPRLQIRNLRIEPDPNHHRLLEVQFDAVLIAEDVREPVSFRAVVNSSEGTLQVHGR